MMIRLCLGHLHLQLRTDTHNTRPQLRSRCLNNNLSNSHLRHNNRSNNSRTPPRLDVRVQAVVTDGARPT
jgi:hypothetical protein